MATFTAPSSLLTFIRALGNGWNKSFIRYTNQDLWIVMEYVDGETLFEHIERATPAATLHSWTSQLAEAFEYLHPEEAAAPRREVAQHHGNEERLGDQGDRPGARDGRKVAGEQVEPVGPRRGRRITGVREQGEARRRQVRHARRHVGHRLRARGARGKFK